MRSSVRSTALLCLILSRLGLANPLKGQLNKLDARQLNQFQTYISNPNVTNPKIDITKSGNGDPAPGYFVFGPESGGARPIIVDNDGQLIWNAPESLAGDNPEIQLLNGKQVLSVFQPEYEYDTTGFTYGGIKIVDTSYNLVQHICLNFDLYIPWASKTPKCQADSHEKEITTDGTLLVPAYNVTQADLTSVGGPKNGWVVEAHFYELELPSLKVLFSWKSLDHVPVNKTKYSGSGSDAFSALDYFHLNSIQKVGKQYLINGRHTFASYLINQDGSVEWEFNGYDGGDFGPLPTVPGSQKGDIFSYQHDARMQRLSKDAVRLTLFNNDNAFPYNCPVHSDGLSFLLNTRTKTSKLLHEYRDTAHSIGSCFEGSMGILPNGNVLVAYGNIPVAQEFAPGNDSSPALTISWGPGPSGGSYRVYKDVWVGNPTTRPDVKLVPKSGMGYVSWNGATAVSKWVVRSGASFSTLSAVSAVLKTGFETQFKVPKGKYVQVVAHDSEGRVLAGSMIKAVQS